MSQNVIYTLAYFCLVSVAKERIVFDTGSSSPVNIRVFTTVIFLYSIKGMYVQRILKGEVSLYH
jgi:hypothetical protein